MINLRLLILFVPMFCFCQNKKQQIINLNHSIDSLNLIISSSSTEIDNLQTESFTHQLKYSKLLAICDERYELINQLQTTNNLLQKDLSKYSFTIDSINTSSAKMLNMTEFLLRNTSSTNQYLNAKAQSYLTSWHSMCFLERIQTLISNEAEWYKTFIPEIIVSNNEQDKILEIFDGNYYNIPSYSAGCTDLDLNLYKLDEYLYVAIDEWPGDWESSSYISLTIISSRYDFEPIVYSILDGVETYISEDCSVLLTRKNDNPCYRPGNIYNLLYFDGEFYGSLEVDFGSDDFRYDPQKLPFIDQIVKLNKTSKHIAFTAYETETGNGPTGNSYDLFKISKLGIPGELSDKSTFNLEINKVLHRKTFSFFHKINKLVSK